MLAIAAEFHPESNRNTASDFFCSRNDPLSNVIRVPANSTLHVKMHDNTARYVLLGDTTVIVDPWGSNYQTALYAQVACTVTVTSFASANVTTTVVLDSPKANVIRNPVNKPVLMPAGGILQINVSEQFMNIVGNGAIADAALVTSAAPFVLDLSVCNKVVPFDFTGIVAATIDLRNVSSIDESVRDWILVIVGAGISTAYTTVVKFTNSGTDQSQVFLTSIRDPRAADSTTSPATPATPLTVQVTNPTSANSITAMAGTHIFITKLANQWYINAIVTTSA